MNKKDQSLILAAIHAIAARNTAPESPTGPVDEQGRKTGLHVFPNNRDTTVYPSVIESRTYEHGVLVERNGHRILDPSFNDEGKLHGLCTYYPEHSTMIKTTEYKDGVPVTEGPSADM